MAKKDKVKEKKSEDSYEIEEIYGMLDGGSKIYARISWYGRKARDEVRAVWYDKDNTMRLGKGVELDEDTIEELYNVMKKKPKPVDFNSIFDSTAGISKKRREGHTTVDGFIVLRKTDGTHVGH